MFSFALEDGRTGHARQFWVAHGMATEQAPRSDALQQHLWGDTSRPYGRNVIFSMPVVGPPSSCAMPDSRARPLNMPAFAKAAD